MTSATLLLLTIFLVTITFNSSSASELSNNAVVISPNDSLRVQISRKLSDLWTWIENKGKNEDSFVGRCFGMARKLKFIMPLIIFKLGVIITTLAFLTIFSLKSLGLLVALLVLNSSGLVAKLAHSKHEDAHSNKAQNIHFHIHPDKFGHYSSVDGYGDHGWYDRIGASSAVDSSSLDLDERLKRLNIYDSEIYER